ncbi:MAG: hypothetical protein AAB490_04080, partial [Patescibacteria group bacterium]
SIGVLGTFVGIFLGLMDFHPRNLQARVPALLEALKTAYNTTIFGMGAAFILKIRGSFRTDEDGGVAVVSGATIDTLAALLERANKSNAEFARESDARLKSIETAIVGDGESTIHTQIIKMRTSIADKQEELIKEFKSFATQMSENNSKAFIKALEEVIRDFNTKITEQFGDNFTQLNLAVGQLLEWQENYKQQVARMVEQLDQSAKAVDSVSVSMGVISGKSEALVSAAQSLEQILRELNEVKKETAANLNSFANASREAKELLPQVEKFLKEASRDVSLQMTQMVNESGEAVAAHAEAISEQRDQLKEMMASAAADVSMIMKTATGANQKLLDNHAAAMQNVSALLTQSVADSGKAVKAQGESIAGQRKQIEDMLTKSNGDVTKIWQAVTAANTKLLDTHAGAMQERFKVFDESMGKEMKKALETLGGQLAALSGKFVQDYTPLTENLREVVKIARDLKK